MPHANPSAASSHANPVALDTLDPTTVRALCDAGYMTARAYVDLAAANGWDRVAVSAVPPMAQQPARAFPVTSVA